MVFGFRWGRRFQPRGQGVWSKAQFHERFCLRQSRWSESVCFLIVPHCIARYRSPDAVRFFVEVARAGEGLLDLPHPLGRNMGADLIALIMIAPVIPPSSMDGGLSSIAGFVALRGSQAEAGDEQGRGCREAEPSHPILAF